MVIVTDNQYVLASKIHHITMDESINYREVTIDSKINTVKESYYQITIVYSPENVNSMSNNRNSDEMRECTVIVRNSKNAHKVFQNLIQQIREQMPDQLYLDKALERLFENNDLSKIVEGDVDEAKDRLLSMEDIKNDRKSKKVRSFRKKKRRNQSVLRAAKRSGGKRR